MDNTEALNSSLLYGKKVSIVFALKRNFAFRSMDFGKLSKRDGATQWDFPQKLL